MAKLANTDRESIDIIIPTMDNVDMAFRCIASILRYNDEHPMQIIVVNNGKTVFQDAGDDRVKIINTGRNLGWTGGLEEGLKHSTSEYVMFMNDDTYIPRASSSWLRTLVRNLKTRPNVAAVGPSSNVVMGVQNMLGPMYSHTCVTSFLIGFCILLRRKALDEAGGVHHMDFGGDDLDLSIRLRDAGYVLLVDNTVFVFHYGFQTGEKVHGTPNKPNGWNSREMTDNTNMELIRKHGFIKWYDTVLNAELSRFISAIESGELNEDVEGNLIRQHVNGGKVVELGCGYLKTVPQAIGVDRTSKGEKVPYEINMISIADVVADVTKPLPFEDKEFDTLIARHVFEHCLDGIGTLRNWSKVLKDGGLMIIACPDETLVDGVELNRSHLHAYTPDTIKNMAEVIGFKEIERYQGYNGISFISCLRKKGTVCE